MTHTFPFVCRKYGHLHVCPFVLRNEHFKVYYSFKGQKQNLLAIVKRSQQPHCFLRTMHYGCCALLLGQYKNRSPDTYELCRMFMRILGYEELGVLSCSSCFCGFVFEPTVGEGQRKVMELTRWSFKGRCVIR